MSKPRKASVKSKTQADARRAKRPSSPERQWAERRDYVTCHRGQVILSPHP